MSQFGSHKFLSAEEDRYLQWTITHYKNKNTLMLHLLRKYGMRAGELVRIRKKDLHPENKTIFIKALKGGKDREFPLSPEDFENLMEIAKQLPSDEMMLFPITTNWLRRIWYQYRLGKKPLHALRHTAAIHIYKQTKDIQMVKQILGHRSLMTTLIYQEFCYQQEEFKKVFLG